MNYNLDELKEFASNNKNATLEDFIKLAVKKERAEAEKLDEYRKQIDDSVCDCDNYFGHKPYCSSLPNAEPWLRNQRGG